MCQSFALVRDFQHLRKHKVVFSINAELEALNLLKQAHYTHAWTEARLRAMVLVQQLSSTYERNSYHVDAAGELPVEFSQSYEHNADRRIPHDKAALQYSLFRHPVDWEQGRDNYPACQQLSDIRQCEELLTDGNTPPPDSLIPRTNSPILSDAMMSFHVPRLSRDIWEDAADAA